MVDKIIRKDRIIKGIDDATDLESEENSDLLLVQDLKELVDTIGNVLERIKSLFQPQSMKPVLTSIDQLNQVQRTSLESNSGYFLVDE